MLEELLAKWVAGMFTSCVDLPSVLSSPYVRRTLLSDGLRLLPIIPTSSLSSSDMSDSTFVTFSITLVFFGDCLCVSRNIVGGRPRLFNIC